MHYTERSFISFLELVGKEALPKKISHTVEPVYPIQVAFQNKCIVAIWDLQDVAVLRK